MKFRATLVKFELDLANYKRDVIKHLTLKNKLAGQRWLGAAVIRLPLPTWSGATRATFQKLAQELDYSVPIGPIVARKSRVPLGLSTSVGSGVVIDKTRWYFGFKYESSLRYLAYNEFNTAIPGPPPQPRGRLKQKTPYGFQVKGLKAWLAFASIVRLPNPMLPKYLKKVKIR